MANQLHCLILVITMLLGFSNCSSASCASTGNNTVNTNKPRFQDCTNYKPTLKKEQLKGTLVLRVNAYVPEQSQTIQYSIVTTPGDQEFFSIDKTTGQIVSAFVFDRDALIRDQEMYITVRATDSVFPSLYDDCIVKVTILDINDNPPIFDENIYEVTVTKDMKQNQSVITITATYIDEGGNNSIQYEIVQENDDSSYFEIDENNGLLILAKSIDRDPGQFYTFYVRARGEGLEENNKRQTEVKVVVHVVDSTNRAPYFIKMPLTPVILNETFQDFNKILAEFEAVSNVNVESRVKYRISYGNYKQTFLLEQINNTAYIKLGRRLDYEIATQYMLTVLATNYLGLNAEIFLKIKIMDENDNIPEFIGETKGTVLEHQQPGTFVMQVHALDRDGTAPNNVISYRLRSSDEQFFQIDSEKGIITTMVEFDHKANDAYMVTVIAEDSSPSVLFNTGGPNTQAQRLLIRIMHRNDCKPQFMGNMYFVNNLPEDATIDTRVVKVTANSQQLNSRIKYSIVKNNVANVFKIDENTGLISVNNHLLDYETIPEYKLIVKAYDVHFYNTLTVRIRIGNVNDNAPRFMNLNVTIPEETVPPGCIANWIAYDPDIENLEIPQGIRYTFTKEYEDLLTIDDNGCLRLLKPLDRDPPYGSKLWQISITATDENGKGKNTTATLNITLQDINDNAPYLTTPKPVVWSENRPPGMITKLTSEDADEQQNGAPYVYSIDPEAPLEIKLRFQVVGDELHALTQFDREDQKEYQVPIKIMDSGIEPMSAISVLQVVIGDENDNKMKQAESHIVVHKYNGKLSDMNIGRVYVNDSDDWDLSDKTFVWDKATSEETLKFFKLDNGTGMITMLKGISYGQYDLRFNVTEKSDHFSSHHVSARATVLVKEISKRSVDQSGSIRFCNVTADAFVSQAPDHLHTPLNRLQNSIASILKASPNDVEIFTINNRKLAQGTFLDVFFAVTGSVYSTSELLNSVLSYHLHSLEEEVGFPIEMIGIDECELKNRTCEQSCRNKVYGSSEPIVINANATSFIGITAYVQGECISDTSPSLFTCFNGGTHIDNTCICPIGFDGPHCEMIDISFDGNGYALYPTIISDNIANISIEMLPQQTDGLVLYIGPMSYNTRVTTQPFVALEIVDGRFVLLLDDGTGTVLIQNPQVISQNDELALDIVIKLNSVEMSLVINKLVMSRSQYESKAFKGILITNGPVQLGNTAIDLKKLGPLYNWTYVPQTKGFNGCLRNLTINGRTIDFQEAILTKNIDLSCTWPIKMSVATLWNIIMVIAAPILLVGVICFIKQKKSIRKKQTVLNRNYKPLFNFRMQRQPWRTCQTL
ncbi:DE-cadherin-like [Anopheles funestus]|uniref:DE-cadherin-like n=1 Tax=Anopheles funestus TaxID=62324 RepID=UPI0020C69CE1|nr:DE-cadherin-like [Anopheles funestus]XP_049293497.1 DE-cadherin-like [Anopheles funestus]